MDEFEVKLEQIQEITSPEYRYKKVDVQKSIQNSKRELERVFESTNSLLNDSSAKSSYLAFDYLSNSHQTASYTVKSYPFHDDFARVALAEREQPLKVSLSGPLK
jgi:hypothetical protein